MFVIKMYLYLFGQLMEENGSLSVVALPYQIEYAFVIGFHLMLVDHIFPDVREDLVWGLGEDMGFVGEGTGG